jgi:hypothetical protein
VEDAPTFTAAIASEDIVAELDIHMGFPVSTEGASAMQLRACRPNHLYGEQINDLFNITG